MEMAVAALASVKSRECTQTWHSFDAIWLVTGRSKLAVSSSGGLNYWTLQALRTLWQYLKCKHIPM